MILKFKIIELYDDSFYEKSIPHKFVLGTITMGAYRIVEKTPF